MVSGMTLKVSASDSLDVGKFHSQIEVKMLQNLHFFLFFFWFFLGKHASFHANQYSSLLFSQVNLNY